MGTAHDGWLPVSLEVDGTALSFNVSHLPYDFLAASTPVLSALRAPVALEPYADAPARVRLVTYSDVPAAQHALAEAVAP